MQVFKNFVYCHSPNLAIAGLILHCPSYILVTSNLPSGMACTFPYRSDYFSYPFSKMWLHNSFLEVSLSLSIHHVPDSTTRFPQLPKNYFGGDGFVTGPPISQTGLNSLHSKGWPWIPALPASPPKCLHYRNLPHWPAQILYLKAFNFEYIIF